MTVQQKRNTKGFLIPSPFFCLYTNYSFQIGNYVYFTKSHLYIIPSQKFENHVDIYQLHVCQLVCRNPRCISMKLHKINTWFDDVINILFRSDITKETFFLALRTFTVPLFLITYFKDKI